MVVGSCPVVSIAEAGTEVSAAAVVTVASANGVDGTVLTESAICHIINYVILNGLLLQGHRIC